MRATTLVSFLTSAMTVLAQSPPVALKPFTYEGCFSSGASLQDQGSYTFQTVGYCQNLTVVQFSKPVMALTAGSNCWIGDSVPSADKKVDDSKCGSKCTGYGTQTCEPNVVPLLGER